ncbi:MAG: FAD-binding oxidoreductase [Solirubrobacteraceae bacterium]
MPTVTQAKPTTFESAAAVLASATAEDRGVRIRGGATKLDWGLPIAPPEIELSTTGLNRILEHNAGDLTAVLEAGVPLAEAQRTFAAAGQMLALDPPLGVAEDAEPAATIGGVVATGDSGPLRHRYGQPRDLIVGATLALSDGSIARAGGKVIKNVAGYDLAKLFAGSYGTLGLILSVSVRLHPLQASSTTALGAAIDADALAAAALALSAAPLEFDALDIAWRGGRGGLLARSAGPEHARRARRTGRLMNELGLLQVEVTPDDRGLWERQRAGQRSRDRAMVRVAARPTALAAVLRATDACDGTLVGRAALGCSYIEVAPDAVGTLRAALGHLAPTTLLDAPAACRAQHDPWGGGQRAAVELMRSVKARFDPAATCNPGLFVGGI